MRFATLAAPALALLAIALALAPAGHTPTASADTEPIVSMDTLTDGNTATAVETIDSCLSTTTGSVFDVDMVIQSVDPAVGLTGFQANLMYDPAVLQVTNVDYNFILTSTGSAAIPVGDSLPDDGDGDFFLAAVMFSLEIVPADGDGVLVRVTMEALGPGASPLHLADVKLADANANPIQPTDSNNLYIGPINDGHVAVDVACLDSDGDTIPDDEDNCPYWYNPDQSLPPWPVATNDPDCDGWSSEDEFSIGTDPTVACGTDAWPPDFDNNGIINILDVSQMTPPAFGSSEGDPDYSIRKDLKPDGAINILDVSRMTPPIFGASCS